MDKTITVKAKGVGVSPQKMRLIADAIRGMNVAKAIEVLHLMRKKGALHMEKALKSGVANAQNLHNLDAESLEITRLTVDEGRKRRKPRFGSRGRVSMLVKRQSHINLELKTK